MKSNRRYPVLTEATVLLMALAMALVMASACRRSSSENDRDSAAPSPSAGDALVRISPGQEPPAATRQSPPATFTPAPTAVAPPTLTPAPLPPTPIVLASQFGPSRNRLTGELMDEPELLQRRPIAIKISNSPAQWTRPQSGLSQADLVFEHVTEGSITRFTAIFYGSTPPKVGPIRSARLIDLELPAMYDAALAFSGSSIGVSRKLFGSDFRERILRTNTAGYYRTGEDKPYEHTLYATTELLWETLIDRGENREPQFGSVMAFSELAPDGGTVATMLTVRYRSFTTIEWRYDPLVRRYLRWADGEEHLDANNGEQLSASNVAVIIAPHTLDDSICEYQRGDQCLAHSTEIHLWDEGPAVVLRDGRAYEVTWIREQRNAPLTFVDGQGQPFPLQMGNTWFQVLPAHYEEAFTLGEAP